MKFADKVKKMIDDAPAITPRMQVNFGPLVVTPLVVTWQGRGNPPEKVSLTDYMKAIGLDEDDDVELDPQKQSFQIRFSMDLSDLNPTLNFPYEREISIVENSKDGKIKTDWSATVLPSLEKVFGKNWYEKILPNGKKAAPVLYVAAENVDSLVPPREGKKNFGVPKFIAVYPDRDTCIDARDERYPRRDSNAETPEIEEDDEAEEEGTFPAEAIESTINLLNSSKGNKKSTLKLLQKHPFGDYDPDELLEAAIAAMGE